MGSPTGCTLGRYRLADPGEFKQPDGFKMHYAWHGQKLRDAPHGDNR